MPMAASVPSTSAIAVAASANFTELHSASPRPFGLPRPPPPVEREPCGGHDSVVAVLNDRIATTSSGRYRNTSVSSIHARSVSRASNEKRIAAQRLSKAPARLMPSRYTTMISSGHSVYAAASGWLGARNVL